MIFTVGLADKKIRIQSIYPELRNFFKDYIIEDDSYDFAVSWTEEDVLKEQAFSEDNTFSLPYLETLAALRKIAEVLPRQNRILMHGASISYMGKGYLFTAVSGTGKSTHIRLWRKHLGEQVQIVNGDKPFLSIEEGTVHIYGSPWAGKENWHRNRSVELNGICFLNRGTTNRIRQMDPEECLSLVFNQIYMPEDPVSTGLTLELLDKLLTNVPLYYLECDISEEAVRCSFEAMTGLPY